MAIQKVCRMRQANIIFMDAFYFPTQQPITGVALHVVSRQIILPITSLPKPFRLMKVRKRRLLADDKL
ncbi:MAG: hypothetical protein QXL57_05835 [Candidatus Bathyarchaeia archaeon]